MMWSSDTFKLNFLKKLFHTHDYHLTQIVDYTVTTSEGETFVIDHGWEITCRICGKCEYVRRYVWSDCMKRKERR
jgi:anti-sigma regulatory factor (Ser/Thr protein kinase)